MEGRREMRDIKFREKKKNPYGDKWVTGKYTGLKDKNGKEIYEGDILYNDFEDEYGYIEFEEGQFTFTYDNVCNENIYNFIDLWEIRGNIYENPELLKEASHE